MSGGQTVGYEMETVTNEPSDVGPAGRQTATKPSLSAVTPTRKARRVSPTVADRAAVNLVEVRPGRVLRVVHLNARPRDASFDDEMRARAQQRSLSATSVTAPPGDQPANYAEVKNKARAVPPGDRVLFFLHGVGGSADVWTAQTSHFAAAGFQVVAPDMVGHGLSPAPDRSAVYSFKEMLKDVFAVFDRYCYRDNVVVGHSYGTSFAAVLARRRAALVSRLVFVSGGSPSPLGPQIGLFSMPACLLHCCRPLITHNFHRHAFHKRRRVKADGTFDVPSHVLKSVMNGQRWPGGGDRYYEGIRVPTLIIHGREDRLVTVDDDREMAEVIPQSMFVVVDNASHMVMMEQAEIVNSLLDDFIV